jgi:hypothetical protein
MRSIIFFFCFLIGCNFIGSSRAAPLEDSVGGIVNADLSDVTRPNKQKNQRKAQHGKYPTGPSSNVWDNDGPEIESDGVDGR